MSKIPAQLQLVPANEFAQYAPIREELVNVAISFLLNPKVQHSPLFQKRQFLLSKGLSNDEIDVAIERFLGHVGADGFGGGVGGPGRPNPMLAAEQAVMLRQAGVLMQPSFWTLSRAIAPSMVLVGGLFYSVYWLYTRYLRPWLLGESACRSPIRQLQDEIRSLADQLNRLQADLGRIESRIQSNFEQEQAIASSPDELAAINDLKTEVSSIKAMMLGKDRFPSTPASSMSIPSWQLSR